MADDIDIEEHDVLDNPHIRTMFPDLSIVKTECLDTREEDGVANPPTAPIEEDGSIRSLLRFEDDEFSNNRIIIGSKPCPESSVKISGNASATSVVKVKQEPIDNDYFDEAKSSGVIILGKRVERDVYGAFVSLEDWKCKLESSNVYCAMCKTLFPTRNRLDAHNMTTHSFLVALESKNTARKSTAKGKQCNHCNLTFLRDSHLINHLYEVANPQQKSEIIHLKPPNKERSKILRCNICTWKFEMEKPYLLHMATKHKVLPGDKNAAVKWVRNENMCTVCGKSYRNNKSYNVHVRREHYNLIYSTGQIPKPIEYMPIKRSRKTPKTYAPTLDKGKQITVNISDALIPKDVLFTCKTCDIFFTSVSSGISHSESCSRSQEQTFKCGLCPRIFLDTDCTIHPLQHGKLQTKFSIYVVVPNIYGKVLCQCPDCKLYLHEKEFWQHYTRGCTSPYALTCNACELQIEMSSFATHSSWHKEMQLNKDSFIRIVYEKRDKEPELELANVSAEVRKEQKTMYYCKMCMCVFTTQTHTARECIELRNKRKICRQCGLMYNSDNHTQLHQNKLIDFNSVTFVNIWKTTEDILPMPDYPKCIKCNVCFLKPNAIRSHECDDKYKSCASCKKKFSDLALKLHGSLHVNYKNAKGKREEAKLMKVDKNETNWPKESPTKTSVKDIMPDLLDKYAKLEVSWNILYVCSVCNVATDTYDEAVEHSQKHFSNLEHFDVVIKECQFCKLNFDSEVYERHSDLHAKSVIDRNTFRILIYDHTTLLTKQWLDIFKELTKTQTDQILTTSLYKHSRNVKLRVVTEGAPQYTLYKCYNCDRYVDVKKISYHCRLPMCQRNSNSQQCSVCDLVFNSSTCLEAHKLQHIMYGDLESRVVVFNYPDDAKINTTLANNTPKCEDQLKSDPKKRLLQILKCKCGIHGLSLKWMKEHFKVCGTETVSKTKCSKCDLLFPTSVLVTHLCYHHADNNLNKYFKIHNISSNPKNPDSEIYKCSRCQVYFMACKTFSYHLSRGHKVRDLKTCNICHIRMNKKPLKRHMYHHHKLHNYKLEDLSVIEFHEVAPKRSKTTTAPESQKKRLPGKLQHKAKKILKQPALMARNTLHKCPVCSAHFLSRCTAAAHMENCLIRNEDGVTGDGFRLSCCGLDFTQRSYMRHRTVHHTEQNLKRSDLRIMTLKLPDVENIEVKPADPSDSESEDSITKIIKMSIYKCHICNICFINKSSLLSHLRREQHQCEQVKCDVCKLNFPKKIITGHISAHQKAYFKYTIISYDDSWFRSRYPVYELVLYQCGVCSQILSHSADLELHYDNEEHNTTETLQCNKCELVLTGPYVNKHVATCQGKYRICMPTVEFLTNVPKDKEPVSKADSKVEKPDILKIIVVSNDVYRCTVCNLHFLDKPNYTAHLNENLHDSPKTACKSCGLHFQTEELVRHVYLHHVKGSFKLKDFNIITSTTTTGKQVKEQKEDDVSLTADDTQDSEYDVNEQSEKRTNNEMGIGKWAVDINPSEYTNKLYRCDKCSINFINARSLEKHWYKDEHRESKWPCPDCGNLFTKHSQAKHMYIHHVCHKLKRNDFEFVTKPYTYVKKTKHDRSLNETTEDCVLRPKQKADNVSLSNDDTKDSEYDVNERSGKRANLQTSAGRWVSDVDPSQYDNKLYRCVKCSINFINAKTLQCHWYTNEHGQFKEPCPECGNLFTNKSLAKHMYVHHDYLKLKRNDLEIVTKPQSFYVKRNHDRSLNDTTEENALRPEKEVDNVSVAADVTQDSEINECSEKRANVEDAALRIEPPTGKWAADIDPTKYTNKLYRCMKCSINFIVENSLEKHWYKDEHKESKDPCPECGNLFTKHSQSRHMYVHHNYLKLKRDEFEIVTKTYERKRNHDRSLKEATECALRQEHKEDNVTDDSQDPEYDDFNECSEKQPNQDTSTGKWLADIDPTKYSNKLYRCVKCSINFIVENSLEKHLYKDEHKQSKEPCPDCGNMFTKQSLSKHMYIHHDHFKLKGNEFEIVTKTIERKRHHDRHLNEAIEEPTPRSKRLKNNHMVAIEANATEVLDLETNETVDVKMETSDILGMPNDNTYIIYKCKSCKVHFLTEEMLKMHIKNKDHSVVRKECINCDRLFSISNLPEHIRLHHETENVNLNVTELDFDDEDEVSQSNDVKMKSEKTYAIKLYKCKECDVHFISQKLCYKHVVNHTKFDVRDYIECKICNFQFRILCLHKHLQLHHESEFDLSNVLIEEYEPNITEHGGPKIELYCAKDKSQASTVVSTTTDKVDSTSACTDEVSTSID